MFSGSCDEISGCWFLVGLLLFMGLLFTWLYQRYRKLRAAILKEERREAQLWVEIDRRREVETRLEAYQAQLETMVAERTKALEESQKELLDQALAVGRAQLAAMVLHNIGNAMTPVTIFVEELKEGDSDILLGYLANCFAEIKEHSVNLNSFINKHERGQKIFAYSDDLLEALLTRQRQRARQIAEIELAVNRVVEILLLQQGYAGGARECSTQVYCNEVIEDALKVMEGSFAKRGISIKKDLESPVPALFVDKDRLLQIFVILFKNSCDAIDKKLGAGLDDGRERMVALTCRVENGDFVVTLTDSGIGLSADECGKVFTFGHSGKGASGFGLYYCREWIERQHGKITLTSPGPGLGVRIEICLPLIKEGM